MYFIAYKSFVFVSGDIKFSVQRIYKTKTFEYFFTFLYVHTHLKNKIENNSTWEGEFYQSEWVKIYSSWVILVFWLHEFCC